MRRQFVAQEAPQGTKFKLFPQAPWLQGYAEPEIVRVSAPAGSLGPGPSDGRMYVIDPVDKAKAYGVTEGPTGAPYLFLPPWRGAVRRPVEPGPEGHFDHLAPGTPEFEAAHVYGSVRFTLDVWEKYFRGPIDWHFREDMDRLEIVLLRHLNNAYAGYGSMEIGTHFFDDAEDRPFNMNFDVLAHETGHLIIYSQVGLPDTGAMQGEYLGFHESAADMVSLMALLHFDRVVDQLLETTSGNLYTMNELNRFAESSDFDQIRIAGNATRLSEFSKGWTKEHKLSEPMTGALFDIFVDIFHESLLERGLISPEVEDLADRLQGRPEYEPVIQGLFDEAYARDPAGFKAALVDARDDLGYALAETWRSLSPDFLNYSDVGEALLAVDRNLGESRYRRLMLNSLNWRELFTASVGPRLSPPEPESHAFSDRTIMPQRQPDRPQQRRLSYRERVQLARSGGGAGR